MSRDALKLVASAHSSLHVIITLIFNASRNYKKSDVNYRLLSPFALWLYICECHCIPMHLLSAWQLCWYAISCTAMPPMMRLQRPVSSAFPYKHIHAANSHKLMCYRFVVIYVSRPAVAPSGPQTQGPDTRPSLIDRVEEATCHGQHWLPFTESEYKP